MKKASYTYLYDVAATVLLVVMAVCFTSCGWKAVRQTTPLLLRADTLMLSAPDSALRLLESVSPMPEWTDRLCSDYVLRLAEARDKCSLPLLPCDSLLNIALAYYDNDDAGRPLALLYKARLEDQMGQYERASKRLTEGLELLEQHPQGTEVRRNMLSTLGNIYCYDAHLYDEAIKVYKELYEYCETNRDRAIALTNISTVFFLKGEVENSKAIEKEALKYAMSASDSTLITNSMLSFSSYFDEIGQTDSALFYAKQAISFAPGNDGKGRYYCNIGYLLMGKDSIMDDSAIWYLQESLKDSSFEGRYYNLRLLSDFEYERRQYKVAFSYLTAYADIQDSIMLSEQSTEIERQMYQYRTNIQILNIKAQERQQKWILICSTSVICFIIILIYQWQLAKRDKKQLISQQAIEKAQVSIQNLQRQITDKQSFVTFLKNKNSILENEQSEKMKLIQNNEITIKNLQIEQQRLQNWLFTQTDIYQKVQLLSKQKDKKDMKVLNLTEQKKLKDIIFSLYSKQVAILRQQHPFINDDDILLLCLQKTELSSKAIALCFGYSDTHPINQRKLRIKEKIERENMNV